MSTSTELPIHDVILKIMYNANREKPVGLTAGDVLWKIDNPEITERYVREVLDWLVREKRIQLYLDKYSLDRYEFLDQKAKYQEEEKDEVIETKNETYYIKPSRKKIKNIKSTILFFLGVLAICSVTYLFTKMERDYVVTTKLINSKTIVNQQVPSKRLFLSTNTEENITKKIEDISYLFSRQHSNNKNLQQEIASLYKITDSLQKQQRSRMNTMQKQLDKSINENVSYTNAVLQKIVFGNIIFLLIMFFTFFKGKI